MPNFVAGNHLQASCFLALVLLSEPLSAQSFQRFPKVKVDAATRIDWLYPLLKTSPTEAPRRLVDGYSSAHQRYVLYGPNPGTARGKPMPLVLFVSYRSTAMGWAAFGPTCIRHGILYAEPLNAGNATPAPERIRIVLDVLDDLRRRYRIDPDRTYIAGYSGGAAIATTIALALPEYFGGLISSNQVVPTPSSPARLERLRERLSVVMFAGEREPAALNVGKLDGPILSALGVRCRFQVFGGLAHAMPSAAAFEAAYRWLEQDLPRRRSLASQRPATRAAAGWPRHEQARLQLEDARSLLGDDKRVHVGLTFLRELADRWPDLPEALEAQQLFDQHRAQPHRPWELRAREERLTRSQILAEIYDRESQGIGLSKLDRAVVAQGAIDNWRVLIAESDDDALVKRAQARLAFLQKLVANTSATVRSTLPPAVGRASPSLGSPAIPSKVRMSVNGTVAVRQVVDSVRQALVSESVSVVVLEEEITSAGLTLDRRVLLRCNGKTPSEVLGAALHPVGLTYQYRAEDNRVEIGPR